MRNKLINSLKERIQEEIAPQSPLKYLLTIPVEDYIDNLISTVYLYTRAKRGKNKSIYMVEIISAIGHGLRNRMKLKKDSSVAAKTGAFMLYSFERLYMIEVILGQGTKNHAAYLLKIVDDESIVALWGTVVVSKASKLPSETPYDDWTTSKHSSGASLIKTGNKEVLKSVTVETHPMIFDAINKSQKMGWQINKELLDIIQWALRNKTEAFSDIWEQQNPEARITKLRESKTIIDIAKKFIGKNIYHLYYYDFRGRRYPTTAYLHEQGSDLAKGILRRLDKKIIGEVGFQWLMISIASNWAGESGREDGAKTDKIPLLDRYTWSLDNEEILLSYAESPKVNQGWMSADKPWQFLSACLELKNLREWQYLNVGDFYNYEYESHLECYVDGTNNGSQHLSALTKDEITAPLVNLTPQELPGDLYKYIADNVWKRIEEQKALLTEDQIHKCESFIKELLILKKEIYKEDMKSENRKRLLERIREFRDNNQNIIKQSCCVWWSKIKDAKHRRKVVKRGVMTLPLVVKTRWK
jgi:hypothetical protein